MLLLLYRVLLVMAVPGILAVQGLRILRGRIHRRDLRERLSSGTRQPDDTRTFWIHGASVGELSSARGLIRLLRETHPDLRFLITSNTETGRAAAARWNLPDTTTRLAPLDLLGLNRRLLARERIVALMVIENEFWPNRFIAAEQAGVPVIVVGARISARSARRWSMFSSLSSDVLDAVKLFSAQDADSQDRFAALGMGAGRTAPILDLKSLYVPPKLAGPSPLAGTWKRSEVLLAASTHPPEEEIVLRAFELLRADRTDLRLIIAPRHVSRAEAVSRMIAASGFTHVRRSDGAAPGTDTDVYLADTMGEMPIWYEAAACAFVGGSLSGRGGHTPHEPTAHGCAVLHGPDVSNFARAYARLDQVGASLTVRDAESLADAFDVAMKPGKADQMASRAADVLKPQQGPEALLQRIGALISAK